MQQDPTEKYRVQINEAINKCNNIFNKQTIWYMKQINPQPPQLTGLPKIHKENAPIRPLINYQTSPGYKAAKILEKYIKNNIKFQNYTGIKNNDDFIEKII